MSNKALSIQLGAKMAEINASLKQIELLKAQVKGAEDHIKASAKKIKATFARYGFTVSDSPTPTEIENGLACMEGFNVRAEQLADKMVSSMGFTPQRQRKRSAE
jgi:hypothetical protein